MHTHTPANNLECELEVANVQGEHTKSDAEGLLNVSTS